MSFYRIWSKHKMPLIGKFLVQQDSIGNNSVVASKIAANAITAS